MCRCCCGGNRKKEKKEYECAVNPSSCPTKQADENEKVPVCCGKPMKEKK